ncbi:dephospho-CoA kinase [Octadecabacter antarcticus]|nr:dephospho-CoA kinase [Octadecabacter antarcticus]
MTFVLGLTGSIGMGKSTTAQMFANQGVPVWDADEVVRELYGAGGKAATLIARFYPDAVEDGAVSRRKLRDLIATDTKTLDHIQILVHPLVAADRAAFLVGTTAKVILLDIPLLFETATDGLCDAIAVVSVPADVQKRRVLARGEMTEADFDLIHARQMSDAQKRSKARWVIPTQTLDEARAHVKDILAEIDRDLADA